MLTFTDVTLRRGARALFTRATFTIFPGQRAGLVGRNGTGKSSLFAMILGELAPDAGNISLPRSLKIATVSQETPALPVPAIEYALDGDLELRSLEQQLAKAEAEHNADRIAHLHEQLYAIDGYAARSRAARLLHGLGFSHEMQARHVADFSGGWRMRLNLARALMRRSDLMLLDEPTNHLDLDAVLWLQDWLKSYDGTLFVISHDREFLDAVTTHTLHLQGEAITLYTGNYSAFERLRAERLAQQAATRAAQERQIAHLQKFVDRFKAQATKAKQAQSRVKMIERIQLVAPVLAESEFSFSFREAPKIPSPMLRLDEVDVGYGDKIQLQGLKLGIEPGDRIGLLGPNGAGKSTLIRLLAGELRQQRGELMRPADLRIGYFAQHQLEQLDPQASPLLHLKRMDPQARDQVLRDYLGSFNFRGDRVFEAITPFSGGEKARLALAMVVYPRPNLLLLDEPTNHLDLDMRQALEFALQDFTGAVLLVSHDRHLIASCCDQLWRVAEGQVTPFDGDLDDYARWLLQREREASNGSKPTKPKAAKAAPVLSASERREQIRNLRDTLKKQDAQLGKAQKRLDDITLQLNDPALYADSRRADVARLTQEQNQLRQQLSSAEEAWLATSTALESLEAASAN